MASLNNREIGELLAVRAESAEGHLKRAYKSAARASLGWPVECCGLWRTERPLTELDRIGPFLAKEITRWLKADEMAVEFDPLRADFLSWIEAQNILGKKKTWAKKCHGDLQMHSLWSDGSSKIADLAESGLARGYEYIAVTDHSKGLKIAGGIDESELERQANEIANLNEQLRKADQPLTVLHAIEMNLGVDGSGDMASEALAKLDIVVGAFHSKLRIAGDQTERYLRALANPDIQILAHPRGRIYNHRLGLQADWPLVFQAAKSFGKAIEIDGYPDRQDLNRKLLKIAAKAGCLISLGSDSHNASQLAFLDYSLAAALDAGISAAKILNFMPLGKLRMWCEKTRRQNGQ